MTPKIPPQPGIPKPTGGRGFPPPPVATATSGMSEEQFRDYAVIAIYAAMAGKFPRERWEWAARRSVDMAEVLLAERNRRRDERKKGGK